MEQGDFREDLFYRLNVVRIDLPSLSQRKEDLPALVAHFVNKYAAEVGRPVPRVSKEAMQVIYLHPWPGNVRELENAIERAVILAGEEIKPGDLPLEMLPRPDAPSPDALPLGLSLNDALEDLERRMIRQALDQADGVAAHAAEALGLTKSNLAYKLKKYGIS